MPLQKSLSEQNRSYRSRQQWQRSKSHASANPAHLPPKRPLAPVSDITKNKLHAFDYRPQVPVPGDENAFFAAPKPKAQEPTNDSSAQHATPTPSSKLAWQDLVGATEAKDEDEDASPTERILWDTTQDPSATSLSPMLPRKKGKKRARSSSPVSSPAAKSKPNTPAMDVKKLCEALKSPHPDPALELWDRFSMTNSSAATPLGAAHPALANMMVSSSPRPPKFLAGANPPPSEGGLRRAISCGAHWPKRRRAERGEYRPSCISTVAEGSPSGGSKSSMVNILLENMTGELNKSSASQLHQDPSRSPSPKKKRQCPEAGAASPPRSSSQSPAASRHQDAEIELPQAATSELSETFGETSSDYGDDDFDDVLMGLDVTMAPTGSNCLEVAMPPPDTGPTSENVPAVLEQTFLDDDDGDDFGDVDDDVFAAAENLVVQAEGAKAQPPLSAGEVQDVGEDAFGDDFGVDFDFEAAEIAATQSAKQSNVSGSFTPVVLKPKAIQRYLVTNVLDHEYTTELGRSCPEKILLVQVDRSKDTKTVHLRGDWVDTAVSPESFIHIIGNFEASGRCIIDINQNILILHPDQLISATVVADSFTCMRRAVLQDRVKATSEASAPLVYGTLLHEIFQEAMMANQWSGPFLNKLIVNISERHVEDLYKIRVSMSDAREHLRSKMPELSSWAAAFVSGQPKVDAVVQGRNGDKALMCVSKLLDVEEHVWSPMYGLKGNIDATVQVTMRDGPQKRTLTVPFEVKTGHRATSNHQAQTSLYNLLLSDRYDIEIAYGILYYMESSQTTRIPAIRHELRHMIMQRNQLACYIRERSVQLPPMKRSSNACGNCYAKVPCFIYHKLADDGDAETSAMKDKFDAVVKHLTPTHQEFFLRWEDLLTKEEKESQKLRRELWTMLSSEREKVGRCFANVMIEEGSALEEKDSPKINRYKYTFIKDTPAPGFSFMDSQLAVGEPIVVSDEQGHFALALGYVTSVRKQKISVAVDRRLHNARIRRAGFNETNNQTFASIMEVVPEGATPTQSQGMFKTPPIRYRLDKDEFSNGMATVRNNLVQVMSDGVFGSREIRRLVVDLAPPTFKSVTSQYAITGPDSLNVDQRKAIEKVMSAKDYALVLGMPGTGKTTTIAHIIRALVRQGKSVLLTSYTHSAVDNILLKLKSDKTDILRLGAPAKVHPEVRDFAILAGQPMKTFEEIHSAWHDTPIVATTCLGAGPDVCLGWRSQSAPPLVQNEQARLGGLDISLFKLLSETHPDSVVNLEHQYRMCQDVMTLSNTLIYNGRLKCGTEELRHVKLHVPDMDALRHRHYDADTIARPGTPKSFCANWRNTSCWLRSMIDPEARVRFINTDDLPSSREEAKGNRTVNPAEAQIVTQLVEALLTAGVPASDIGVMTHYRSQLSLLKHHLRRHGSSIELHTADRFQGRDKEVVVLSLVRSNESCNIGDLLKDWRRINVAFTRAKTKLLVVGSRSTLRGSGDSEMVSRFVRLMEERDWVYDLPADALDSHYWPDESATQATAATGVAATQKSLVGLSPRKRTNQHKTIYEEGQENNIMMRRAAKKGRVTDKALLKGKPILQDIFSEIVSSGGSY
ncbi:DNA replication ATP-dependent helicase Dna2 [Apiospora hydei]|uniref:DNA replication ATP-dependent helicase/nuclease n=1 Tax=Apiospora hydei TaxID=1337664 RepID=A0ABR1V482_9PEZI